MLFRSKSPIAVLDKIFAKFKEWLTEIYNGIKGSEIDVKLNKPMRAIYSSMLGEKTEEEANLEKVGKELGIHPSEVANRYKKYGGEKALSEITKEDYESVIPRKEAENKAARVEAFRAIAELEERKHKGTDYNEKALQKKIDAAKEADKTRFREAQKIMNMMEGPGGIREQLLKSGEIKETTCFWGKG